MISSGSSCLGKDGVSEEFKVVLGVGVVESIVESVDEDTWLWRLDLDIWVHSVGTIEWQEDIARAAGWCIRAAVDAVDAVWRLLVGGGGGWSAGAVDLGLSEETSTGLGEAEEDDGSRRSHGSVDTVLNVGEDGNKDTQEEDGDLNWGHLPELVDSAWWGDQVSDGVNDDRSQCTRRNVKEDGSQSIQGEEDENGSKDTSERSPDTGLGLDGSSREGSSGWVGTKEGTEDVGETNGNKLLGWVDGVVVDSTERLGDGNVLNEENDDGGGEISSERLDRTG